MKTIDLTGWTAKEMGAGGVIGLLVALRGAELVEEVGVGGLNTHDPYSSYYAAYGSVRGVGSAGLLSDGRVMVLDVRSEGFAGTFEEHGEAHTQSWMFTPPVSK